jgi:oxygen-independent coproporphyrinogen-3 oxidase
VDPRTVDEARLRHIKSLGFNRISFGIQDLDTKVQISINREQNYRQILDLIIISRMLGFKSINVDLIYGLPNQTLATFVSTLNKIIDLRPDRIALYSYAHMPSLFKSQILMDENSIPNAEVKIIMFQDAIKLFIMSGYDYIGMDHFALPDDELSIAKKQGKLHRNFQGYTTNLYETIGLGISSISQYQSHYLQNTKHIPDY